ncbi:MAG: hypothetical protein IKK38_00615 [Spirochaetaceae bacterium]|nr:hypothetical protein [Spirochaetaceae bacterium]
MEEELLEMAKAENIELNAEQAAQAFAKMNKNGELSNEELDNVAHGGCGGSEGGMFEEEQLARA